MSSVKSLLLNFSFYAGVMLMSQNSFAANAIALSSGNWNEPARWTAGIGQPGQNQVDEVYVRNGYSLTVNTNVNQAFGISNMLFTATAATGTVTIQNGGALTISGTTEVVRTGATIDDATGTLNVAGGSFATGTLLLSGGASNDRDSAIVNLTGGSLTVNNATVVGYTAASKTAGFFNVTGSTITANGGSLTVNEFGTMRFTLDTVGVSTLNYSGAATFATNSTLTIDGTNYTGGSANFTLINAASLTGGLATINDSIIGFNSLNYTTNLVFDNANGDVVLQVTSLVPEPSTWALIGLGLGVVVWKIRKRRVVRA